jgi:hypothetical protein
MLSESVAVQKGTGGEEVRRGTRGVDIHRRETLFQGIRGDMPQHTRSREWEIRCGRGKFSDTKHIDLSLRMGMHDQTQCA